MATKLDANAIFALLLPLLLLLLLLCTPTTTLLLAVLIRMIGAIAKGNKSKNASIATKQKLHCSCNCEFTWNLIGGGLARGSSLHYEGNETFHLMHTHPTICERADGDV